MNKIEIVRFVEVKRDFWSLEAINYIVALHSLSNEKLNFCYRLVKVKF
jgi:hypothetical protein